MTGFHFAKVFRQNIGPRANDVALPNGSRRSDSHAVQFSVKHGRMAERKVCVYRSEKD